MAVSDDHAIKGLLGRMKLKANEKQKEIWNKRAEAGLVNHPDPFQSELELDFMLENVKGRVINIGCGSGIETVLCAKKTGFAVGVDFSENMIELARAREGIFRVGDALNLEPIVEEFGLFDTVTTRRTLINLCGWKDQKQAIKEFRRCLKPEGRLILIEATEEGYLELNLWRRGIDIPEIKVVSFNYPLPSKELNFFMKIKWKLVENENMATYYFLTRVFYPLIEEPEYGSLFAEKAMELQKAVGSLNFNSPILMRLYLKTEGFHAEE